MPHSLDLLDMALAQTPNQAFWCRNLNVSRNVLAMARARGRLAASVAGNLARLLGFSNETPWIALAALEAEPRSHARDKMLASVQAEVTRLSKERHTYTAS